MLRSTSNLNHGIDIENYSKLWNLLRRKSKGFAPKRANTFSTEDINKFINKVSDNKYLATEQVRNLKNVQINFSK